jgi:hypothetical protein
MDFSNLDYYLDINGLSRHINPQIEYQEVNPGFGITAENTDNRLIKALMAGGYKNSFGEPSYYGAGSLAKRFGDNYYADIGAFGGLATGYEDRLTPIAGLLATLGKKDLGRLQFMLTPPADKADAVLMMKLGIPFK